MYFSALEESLKCLSRSFLKNLPPSSEVEALNLGFMLSGDRERYYDCFEGCWRSLRDDPERHPMSL